MTLLTIKEAASYLRLSSFTVYRLAKSGQIPSVRIGGSVRFHREMIDHWLEEQVSPKQLAILVVDDDPRVRKILAEIVTDEGHEAVAVASGEEALDALAGRSFNLVFLDLLLPGMNGLEVLKEIKRLYSQTQVAIVTGYADTQLAIDATSLGPVVLLRKPVKVEDVRQALSLVLGVSARARARGRG